MENTANRITLTGTLASLPEYSHQNHERKFFRFLLSVDRLSGTEDLLPVLAAALLAHSIGVVFGSKNAVRINQIVLKKGIAVFSILIAVWKLAV